MKIYNIKGGPRYYSAVPAPIPAGSSSIDIPLAYAFDALLQNDIAAGVVFVTFSSADQAALDRVVKLGADGAAMFSARAQATLTAPVPLTPLQQRAKEVAARALIIDTHNARVAAEEAKAFAPAPKQDHKLGKSSATSGPVTAADVRADGAPVSLGALNKINAAPKPSPVVTPPAPVAPARAPTSLSDLGKINKATTATVAPTPTPPIEPEAVLPDEPKAATDLPAPPHVDVPAPKAKAKSKAKKGAK